MSNFFIKVNKLSKEIKKPSATRLKVWKKALQKYYDFELADDIVLTAYYMRVAHCCVALGQEFKEVFYYSSPSSFTTMAHTGEREMMLNYINLILKAQTI